MSEKDDPTRTHQGPGEERGTLTHHGAREERGTLSHGGVEPDGGTLSHGGIEPDRGTLSHGGVEPDRGTLSHGGVQPERETLSHAGQAGPRRVGSRPVDDADQPTGSGPALTDEGQAATGSMPAPAPDLGPREWHVGDVIDGRYEVRALLGRGGMGQVVRVHHREWGVDLAVKTPLPKLVGDARARARFLREAETWVALGMHPNVVGCWYVRELDGLPRLFLDHVSGGSLKEAMREQRVLKTDLPLVLDLVLQAADGLAHAHRLGVVHRDVKPANLLLTGDGRLQVTDFGLVRRVEEAAEPEEAPVRAPRSRVPSAPLTGDTPTRGQTMTSGGGLGTPEYAAPEQWSAASKADARADVYALGVSLFELLAGRRPFDDPEHPEPSATLIARHMTEPAPDVRTFAPAVPEPLARAIARCLEKEPARRFADAATLRRELAELYATVAPGRRPRPEPRAARLRAGALNNRAVSFCDLGRPAPARDAWEEALELDPQHAEASYNRALVAWRLGDPMATELARLDEARSSDRAASLRAGLLQLERMSCESALELLADALESRNVAADPLAWRALGATLMGLARDADAADAFAEAIARAPDDRRTRALLEELRAGRAPAAVARPRDLSALLGASEDTAWTALAATPDGKLLLAVAPVLTDGQDVPPAADLVALPASALEARAPVAVARRAGGPAALQRSRGGEGGLIAELRAMAEGSGLGGAVPAAGATVFNAPLGAQVRAGSRGSAARSVARVLLEAARVAPAAAMRAQGTVTGLAVTPDGALAATVSAEGHLEVWVLRTGGCRRSFELKGTRHAAIALSPDGTCAAVAAADGTLALWDLEEMDVPGVVPRAPGVTGVTALAGCPVAPRALAGHADGRVSLVELAGWRAGQAKALAATGARVQAVAWSPDGALGAVGGADGRIHLVDAAGGAVHAVEAHARPVTSLAFAPDGQTLASAGADHTVVWHTVADLRAKLGAAAGAAGGPVRVRKARGRLEGLDAVAHVGVLAGGTLCGAGAGRVVLLEAGADRSLLRAPLLVCRGQVAAEQEALALRFEELIESARQALARRDGPLAIAFAGAARAVNGFEHDPEALALEERASAGQPRRRLRGAWLAGSVAWHPRPVMALAVSGRTLVTAGEDAVIRVLDRDSEQCAISWQPHRATPRALALSPDGMLAISGDDAGAVWLMDLTGGEPRELGRHAGPVHAAVFLDGARAATCGGDGVRVWPVAGGAPVALDRPARALCASGGRLGVGAGKELLAWDAAPGAEPRLLGTSNADIEMLVASRSGDLLLSAGADRALQLWRAGSDAPAASYVTHQAAVRGLALTPDERFALSAGADGVVVAWELASNIPHRVLPRAGDLLYGVTLADDASMLLSGGHQVRGWKLDWEYASAT